ncbi:MAG TPA: hypothetical protein VNK96_05580 [Fimbriimonadales bacterium]|nr:hypothetical protein [Fimbriimonadales bacterium]
MYTLLRCFAFSLFCFLFLPSFPSNPPTRSLSKEILECIEPALVMHLTRAYEALAQGRAKEAEIHARLASVPETLRVEFSFTGVDPAREEELKNWARTALEDWNEAQNVTRFRESLPGESSNIVICFYDYGMGRNIAGSIFWNRRVWKNSLGMQMELSAEIRITNRRPSGSLMDESQIRHTIQHELGHLLGLREGITPMMGGIPIHSSKVKVGFKETNAMEEFQAHVDSFLSSIPRTTQRKVPTVFRFVEP